MSFVTEYAPGVPIRRQPPMVRHIKAGRRAAGKAFPQALDHFLVCLLERDPDDPAKNLRVDDDLMAALLARQVEIDRRLGTEKLRRLEVVMPDGATPERVFFSEFVARDASGARKVCSGCVGRAIWRGPAFGIDLPRGIRVLGEQADGSAIVECAGKLCPLWNRKDERGKPIPPSCDLEWDFFGQIALLQSGVGCARLRSRGEVGHDAILSTLLDVREAAVRRGRDHLSGVVFDLALRRIDTQHKGEGVWTPYLDLRMPALALIAAAEREEARLLATKDAPRALLGTPAPTVVPVRSQVVEAEYAEDDPPIIESEPAEPSGSGPVPPSGSVDPTGSAGSPPHEVPDDAPGEAIDVYPRLRDLILARVGGDKVRARAVVADVIQRLPAGFPAPKGGAWVLTADQEAEVELTIDDVVPPGA